MPGEKEFGDSCVNATRLTSTLGSSAPTGGAGALANPVKQKPGPTSVPTFRYRAPDSSLVVGEPFFPPANGFSSENHIPGSDLLGKANFNGQQSLAGKHFQTECPVGG